MFELQGQYAGAKVFADSADSASISQVINLLNQPYAEGSRIRMMPDIHAGKGCTIGTTMTIGDKVCPNLVGVDIGCGMETVRLKEKHIEPQKLDRVIREKVPSGFEVRETAHRYADEIDLTELRCFEKIHSARALLSIGTLGGGNHFIEADRGEDGALYLVVHSGSRHLGVEVAAYYQDAAYQALSAYSKAELEEIICRMKAEGRQQEIQGTLKKLKEEKRLQCRTPYELAYAEGGLLRDYLHDMKIAQRFAELNRRAIMDTIIKGMRLHVTEQFTTVHNYIDAEQGILRKGAVSAQAGEKLLIPINMRDGSLICTGKGNEDWNFSAPHGAGRLLSRSEAKEAFTVSEFKKQMQGIYTTSVGRGTLDECPMAYKSMEDIVNNITPTAEIRQVIRPIYNFKAGEEE